MLPKYDELVLHNAKHDLKWLWKKGLVSRSPRLFDTMIAAYFQMYTELSLQALVSQIYQKGINKFSPTMLDQTGMLTPWVDYEFPTQELRDHNCTDVLALKLVYEHLKQEPLPPAFKLEMAFVPIIAEMEERGVLVNNEAIPALDHKLRWEKESILLPCNPYSPPQVKSYFGIDNAQEHTLKALKNPEADAIVRYKKLHLRLKYLEHYRGRMHPDYNMCVVPSGRLSCSGEANLQQVPKEYDFRSLFIPKPGHVFIVFDFDQGEYVVAVRLSGDEELNRRIDAGEDFHQYVLDWFFGGDRSTKNRTKAKNMNFGGLYLGGAMALLEYAPAGTTLSEVQRFLNQYGLRKWAVRFAGEAQENGYADTPLGRRRLFDKPTEMVNHAVQGGLIEIVKAGMVKTRQYNPVLQAHDEVVYEVPIGDAVYAYHDIKRKLQDNPFGIRVSGGIYYNWGEAMLKPDQLAQVRGEKGLCGFEYQEK